MTGYGSDRDMALLKLHTKRLCHHNIKTPVDGIVFPLVWMKKNLAPVSLQADI